MPTNMRARRRTSPDLPPRDPCIRGRLGGPPGWQEAALDKLPKYVESFSPGVLKKVSSPHYMDPAVPERIPKEVETLIASVSQQGAAHGRETSKK
jgi:hypothetical protein